MYKKTLLLAFVFLTFSFPIQAETILQKFSNSFVLSDLRVPFLETPNIKVSFISCLKQGRREKYSTPFALEVRIKEGSYLLRSQTKVSAGDIIWPILFDKDGDRGQVSLPFYAPQNTERFVFTVAVCAAPSDCVLEELIFPNIIVPSDTMMQGGMCPYILRMMARAPDGRGFPFKILEKSFQNETLILRLQGKTNPNYIRIVEEGIEAYAPTISFEEGHKDVFTVSLNFPSKPKFPVTYVIADRMHGVRFTVSEEKPLSIYPAPVKPLSFSRWIISSLVLILIGALFFRRMIDKRNKTINHLEVKAASRRRSAPKGRRARS